MGRVSLLNGSNLWPNLRKHLSCIGTMQWCGVEIDRIRIRPSRKLHPDLKKLKLYIVFFSQYNDTIDTKCKKVEIYHMFLLFFNTYQDFYISEYRKNKKKLDSDPLKGLIRPDPHPCIFFLAVNIVPSLQLFYIKS